MFVAPCAKDGTGGFRGATEVGSPPKRSTGVFGRENLSVRENGCCVVGCERTGEAKERELRTGIERLDFSSWLPVVLASGRRTSREKRFVNGLRLGVEGAVGKAGGGAVAVGMLDEELWFG